MRGFFGALVAALRAAHELGRHEQPITVRDSLHPLNYGSAKSGSNSPSSLSGEIVGNNFGLA